MAPIYFFTILGIFVIVGTLFFLINRNIRRKRLIEALGLKLLLVCLPKKQKKDTTEGGSASNWKEEVNLSAQLFSILSGLKSPFVLETAVHHIGEEINFYVGVPKDLANAISRQIEGLFKDAQVEQIDDYNIFVQSGESIGIYLKQKFSYAMPLRTYNEANVDTFSPILNGLSKISELSEGGAIQIIAKPAPAISKKNILGTISRLKKGEKAEEVLNASQVSFKDISKAVNPDKKSQEKEKEKIIIDEEVIKSLNSKISQPLLAVNYRVIASARNLLETNSILDGIIQGITQFSAPLRQELKIIKPRNIKKLLYQFSFRIFDDEQSIILNTEELASLFHLPISITDIPNIKWLRSKEIAPPQGLAKDGTPIGESVFRAERKPVYITDEDRRRHVYIIGQTGTGKTTAMINMIIDDIKKGKGISVIDPHGDLVDVVLSHIPKERADDVIVFDPGDLWKPIGMNMLEYDFRKPEQKTFIINELFSILDKLYDMKTAGGPMFEQYTKNAILLLMEDMANEPATLMEIPRIFTDDSFRLRKLARITNPTVIDFWEKEAVKATGEHSLSNMSSYITSKFNNFISNDYMRPIIGQLKSAFNFRQVMDEGKILLVNLSKGRIGDINANLLGMVIIGKILMAALSRIDISQEDRRDFNLYIDEFQNFTTDSTSIVLSESRKYRLNLTVAHQFIAQLSEKIRDSVFGNVGSKIVFRVGVPDAEFLAKEFEPFISMNDLTNISNLSAYAKILINGHSSSPFNIRIPFPDKGNIELIEQMKEISRNKFGKERQQIEEEIMKRLRL